jgi:hypothetical protein
VSRDLRAAGLRAQAETLGKALAAWAKRDDPKAQWGVRRSANEAVAALDDMLSALHKIRQQLTGEMRRFDDAAIARAAALLAECRAREAAGGGRPEWLYGSGCCERWTPEDGCPWHTGRPAMSLKAREPGTGGVR